MCGGKELMITLTSGGIVVLVTKVEEEKFETSAEN